MSRLDDEKILTIDVWTDKVLVPITEVLMYTEEIEMEIRGLNLIEFSENYELTLGVQKNIVLIGECLESIKENDPSVLERYDTISWDKYIRIGMTIEIGGWPYIFEKAWKFATKGISEIRMAFECFLES